MICMYKYIPYMPAHVVTKIKTTSLDFWNTELQENVEENVHHHPEMKMHPEVQRKVITG